MSTVIRSNCCDPNESTQNIDVTNTLPTSFNGSVKYFFIDISNTAPIDLTTWMPTGQAAGTVFRLRKVIDNKINISYFDGKETYKHLRRRGAVMTLVWSQLNRNRFKSCLFNCNTSK